MNKLEKIYKLYRQTGALLVVLIVLTGSIFYVLFGANEQPSQPGNTKVASVFRVDFEFDVSNKKISIKNIKSLVESISGQTSSALPTYEAVLTDSNKKVLYKTKVDISERIFFDRGPGETLTTKKEDVPKKISSVIYLPYYPNAINLSIYKNGENLLSRNIPPDQRIYAKAPPSPFIQTAGGGGYRVAIIGDGFPNSGTFQGHVNTFISAVRNEAPFGDIFEFVPFEGAPSPGCTGSILGCIQSGPMQTAQSAAKAATGANGVVVLVNGGGTSAAMGGTGPAVINVTRNFSWNAKHEFLGHMIGNLNDRYDNTVLGGGGDVGLTESNCTMNSSGLSWWNNAGATGVYPKCQGPSSHSPFPHDPTCPYGGTKNTIMSNCPGASLGFDSVENHWIRNCIIPPLTGGSPAPFCSGGGGGNPTPTPTPGGQVCDFPGGLAGFDQFCREGGADGAKADCSDCYCKNNKPWPNADGNCVIGGGGNVCTSTISWNVMPQSTGYEIRWIAGPTNTGVIYTEGGQAGTTYTFRNLAPGSYSWTVRGIVWAADFSSFTYTGESVGIGQLASCPTPTSPPPPTQPPLPTATTKPTATTRPQPTATTRPLPTATTVPGQPTATPTNLPGQPTPTPTPIPTGDAKIAFKVSLTGIGSNTSLGQNSNPIKQSLPLKVALFDSENRKIKDETATITFDPASTLFKGEMITGELSGSFTAKIRLNNSLWKELPGIVFLIPGQTSQADSVELVSGDLNQDNEMNLIDYNIMVSCFGGRDCQEKELADLNLDGNVNELDLNILYSSFAKRRGD